MNWPELFIGAVIGAGVGLRFTFLQEKFKKERINRRLSEKFCGTWERTYITQYQMSADPDPTFNACRGSAIHIAVNTDNALNLTVHYDTSRGYAKATINLVTPLGDEGVGAYAYPPQQTTSAGQVGSYEIHLLAEDELHVTYYAKTPVTFSGYETWHRRSKELLPIDASTHKTKV